MNNIEIRPENNNEHRQVENLIRENFWNVALRKPDAKAKMPATIFTDTCGKL